MPDFLSGISLRSLAVICADLDSRRQSFFLEAEHVAPTRLPIALVVASVDRVTRSRQTVTFSELVGDDPRVETIIATFLTLIGRAGGRAIGEANTGSAARSSAGPTARAPRMPVPGGRRH